MILRRAACAAIGLAGACLPVGAAASTLTIPPQTAFGMTIVAAHNRVRSAAGVPPIIWDSRLAAAAAAYADVLASSGRWQHSPRQGRRGQGENLWMGTRGAFSLDRMVGGWASEGGMFRPGMFPNVSRTGNWEDVAHYTQMIWPSSTRLGCAIRSSRSYDYLVCRYAPAGNVTGVFVP